MEGWSTEQVLALAPDSASVSAGRELSNTAKWASSGKSDAAAWGEAKGSGAKPYQTAIDLREIAFKCSCPSRKFPCKHALGLFLQLVRGDVSASEPPTWVTEWLEKRQAGQEKKAAKQEAKPPVDEEAAAKRAERRWSNILSGLDELESFLCDIARQGLLSAQSTRTWDEMAARMVDAQAPGLSRRLRRIGSVIGVGPGWADEAAGQMGELSLLIEATRRLDRLKEGEADDVRVALGIPARQQPSEESITDTWDVLGSLVEEEDRFKVNRTWLRGRDSGRWALLLGFTVAGQVSDIPPAVGTAFEGSTFWHPSAWPHRVREFDVKHSVHFAPIAGGDWESELDRASLVWSKNPWLEVVPIHLKGARVSLIDDRWHLLDQTCASLPLAGGEPWKFLAATGGEPCNVVAEWNGRTATLTGFWPGGKS